MFWLKKIEPQPDGSNKITVHIESACCKQDLVFIEESNGKLFDMQTMTEAHQGAVEGINRARREGLVWNK